MNTELEVLARIERARRAPARVRESRVTLAHGSGGRAMHDLVEAVFLHAFDDPLLHALEDQAVFAVDARRLALTTDSYVVSPLFFPGGNIGSLAVHGTINDLAVGGATPRFLAAGFIIEEGLPIDTLQRVASAMADAARAAGVRIVAGDTKVVERGKADALFVTTTGIGVLADEVDLGAQHIRPGDRVLVSGPVGDHGLAVLLARGDLELESGIVSDSAPIHLLTAALLETLPRGTVRAMRDPTRGGLATTCVELALRSDACIMLEESAVPVRAEVRGACEILGLDPLYVASEGRLVAVVAPEAADAALHVLRELEGGEQAAIAGEVVREPAGRVLLRTIAGGTRVVDMLAGDQLPRIC